MIKKEQESFPDSYLVNPIHSRQLRNFKDAIDKSVNFAANQCFLRCETLPVTEASYKPYGPLWNFIFFRPHADTPPLKFSFSSDARSVRVR